MSRSDSIKDFSVGEVFYAYRDARRHKRGTTSQLASELDLEENLVTLWRELNDRTYIVGTSICFTINDTVAREVFAAEFRDRVVHHVLYNRIAPFLDRRFICDSYSCRPGKGTLYGINRLEHHIRSCSRNYTEDCYILKLDIRSYFMHIDRARLFRIIDSSLPQGFPDRDSTMWLCRLIIDCEPVINCRVKGSLDEWRNLPRDKSLFCSDDGCGIPIGNLTSQLFSNIYLNVFDQWIKLDCGVKHYGRYVDDFYIVHHDKQFLLAMIPKIREFLQTSLGLELHPRKIYLQHYSKGVKFLGMVIYPHHRIPAKSQMSRARRRFSEMESGECSPTAMRSRINSYLGLFRQCSAVSFIKFLMAAYHAPFSVGYYLRIRDSFTYRIYKNRR